MKIGVVGGGSAGYFTSLYLAKNFKEYEITLIESSKIPIIGVGEATTPIILRFLHRDLGFPVNEFYKEVKPTLKTSVRFNWGLPNHYFDNAFGPLFAATSIALDGNTRNANLNSVFLQEDKVPFIRQGDDIIPIKVPNIFAYHLDNKKLVDYLKKKFLEQGINHWDTEIKDVKQNTNGDITDVISNVGDSRKFDLIIDCSGFSSLIMGNLLKSRFIDYDKTLFTNKAIVGKRLNNGKPKPYTSATTLQNGWLWNTPTRNEDHLGYVFCDKFCSVEEARKEMSQFCDVDDTKVISFRTGRYENSWKNNVIAIGNSFAFIEPLESTGIHMIVKQIYSLGEELKRKNTDEKTRRNSYNEKVNGNWDLLKNFIGLHFKFNNHTDSSFWNYCKDNVDLSDIQFYLDFFEKKGPVCAYPASEEYKKLERDVIFPPFTFDLVMVNSFKDLKMNFPAKNDALAKQKYQLNLILRNQALYHNEALEYLEKDDMSFINKWFFQKTKGDHVMDMNS